MFSNKADIKVVEDWIQGTDSSPLEIVDEQEFKEVLELKHMNLRAAVINSS